MQKQVSKSKGRRRIIKAFCELLLEERYDEMSVKEIIVRSDTSRSTFYLHFDSKQDLALQLEDTLIEGFLEIMIELRRRGAQHYCSTFKHLSNSYYERYFCYIHEHAEAFSALFSPNCTTGFKFRFAEAIARTRAETVSIWRTSPCYCDMDGVIDPTYREEILSEMYLSLFSTWLNHGCDLTASRMAEMLVALWKPITGCDR